MLKETIISIVVIVAIVLGNYATQNSTKEKIDELTLKLGDLRKQLIQAEVNNEKIQKETQTLYQEWEHNHDELDKILSLYIEHNELEKIETELTGMKSRIEIQEYQDSIDELDKSVFLLKHIEDKYAFNLQNIF